jgi:hypothetical protein
VECEVKRENALLPLRLIIPLHEIERPRPVRCPAREGEAYTIKFISMYPAQPSL